MLIVGPSQCGKTRFIYKCLRNLESLFPESVPKLVTWCYSARQPIYDTIEQELPFVHFHEGLPTNDMVTNLDDSINSRQHKIIILDDLMSELAASPQIEKLFTIYVHHNNLTTWITLQNVFVQGKAMRNISLNCNYMCLFHAKRDGSQIRTLSRQIYPQSPMAMVEAHEDATRQRYGYLLVDISAPGSIDDSLRMRTNIFPGEDLVFYKIKSR